MKILLRILAGVILIGMTLGGAGALYHSPLHREAWRVYGSAGYVVAIVLGFVCSSHRGRALLGTALVFTPLVGFYLRIAPSNHREVRTTYRQPQEDVHVYCLRPPRENIRRFFLEYIRSINELRENPRFYNTLTTNCTANILFHSRVNPDSPPMSWKVLLSGYVPNYLYELGRLDTSRPFHELERPSLVNAHAHGVDQDPAFSQRIREGLPSPLS